MENDILRSICGERYIEIDIWRTIYGKQLRKMIGENRQMEERDGSPKTKDDI